MTTTIIVFMLYVGNKHIATYKDFEIESLNQDIKNLLDQMNTGPGNT